MGTGPIRRFGSGQNFHTTALCSPTRSCLMTGRNHTTNGMAGITEITDGYPNANGHIPFECANLAEVLGQQGWNTYHVGVSFAASFDDASADTGKHTQFYSMLGTRALWHQGWKAASLGPSAPSAWGNFSTQRWELFHTDTDPSECHDLAEAEPGRLRELIDIWWVEAGKYQALPLETRNAVQAITTPRPELSKPRTRYTYFPGGAEVPESQAPNIRGRSYTIAAEVEIDSQDAAGVLFSQGSRFGGHALYVKDGRLTYVYNFVGEAVQVIRSSEPVPVGHVVLSASFEREGDVMPPQGTLSLYIRDQKAGEGTIRSQPGKFGLGGGGLVVGHSGAAPVTDDYPGQRPWAFTGGTITRVVIDVSGQAFVDLAREAAAAFARQ